MSLHRVFLILALAVLSFHSPPAHAVSKDVRTVMITGAYGIVGGAAVGLVSYPFTGEAKSIFVGASVGLYLGIAVGIYHVLNRDDPDNPLRSEASPPGSGPLARRTPLDAEAPTVRSSVAVFRF